MRLSRGLSNGYGVVIGTWLPTSSSQPTTRDVGSCYVFFATLTLCKVRSYGAPLFGNTDSIDSATSAKSCAL
jgi:hypothetical protein